MSPLGKVRALTCAASSAFLPIIFACVHMSVRHTKEMFKTDVARTRDIHTMCCCAFSTCVLHGAPPDSAIHSPSAPM